jgi:hypothetical protein
MSDAQPNIDFTQIAFPSDKLTIKELRKSVPHSFDLPARERYQRSDRKGFFKRESLENYLGGIINTERELAALAFYKALGQENPTYNDINLGPRWEAAEVLIRDWVKVGLTTGKQHGEQLIRDVESQAVAQAQRYLGSTPPR